MAMAYWVTQTGIYYEAEEKIGATDMSVERRPTPEHHWINGKWVEVTQGQPFRYRSNDSSEYYRLMHAMMAEHIRLMQQQGYNPNRRGPQLYIPPEDEDEDENYNIIPPKPKPPPKEKEECEVPMSNDKKDVVLTQNTKVMFGLKELGMVAAFVITATISWQDTNSRIIKLEDNKSVVELRTRIKNLETELKDAEKTQQEYQTKTEASIRELEQLVFMRGNNSIKK